MELYHHGPKLLQEIKATRLPDEALALWALGQEGFLVKYGETTVLFDPYLSNWVYELVGAPWERKFVPPLDPEDCGWVDYVVCSHHHEDHMDKLTLQAIARPGHTRIIAPRAHLPLLREWGIPEEQLRGISHGESATFGEFRMEAFAAMHEEFETDEHGEHKYMGFAANFGPICLYHAGDTVGFTALTDWLHAKRVDIAMLPINGRDFVRKSRGIIGNCNYREAVEIAAQIRADLLIPMHFGLFPHNDENPAYFVDYLYAHYPQQRFHMFTPGERFIYWKG